jgi:peroxiredoxin Q/BCP
MRARSAAGAELSGHIDARVKVGDSAPDFTLKCNDGSDFTLRSQRGKAVVLFFYSQDDSTSCTRQCQRFDNLLDQFAELGAVVYGLSSDSLNSHIRFADKYGLRIPLLADTGGRVRALYGNPERHFRLIPRITYVVDQAGVVRHITCFRGVGKVQPHIDEALQWARRLTAK